MGNGHWVMDEYGSLNAAHRRTCAIVAHALPVFMASIFETILRGSNGGCSLAGTYDVS